MTVSYAIFKENTEGLTINQNIKITSVSFADDNHPLARTKEDLQKQFDIISKFLELHGMKMNAAKSKILTNIENNVNNAETIPQYSF